METTDRTTTERHAAVIEAIKAGSTFTAAAEAEGYTRASAYHIVRAYEKRTGEQLTRGQGGTPGGANPDSEWGRNRAQGLCGACGGTPMPGRSQCAACRERNKGAGPVGSYVATEERKRQVADELASMERLHCPCGLRGQHACLRGERSASATRGPSRLALATGLAER